MPQQIAGLIELEDRRRAGAAFALSQSRAAFRCSASVAELRWMIQMWSSASTQTPIVGAEDPVIGKRLRPERVDFEPRRHDAALGLRGRGFLEHGLADGKRAQKRGKAGADEEVSRARQTCQVPHSVPPAAVVDAKSP